MKIKNKKFIKVPAEIPVSQLTPLDITCGSTKCEEGLHSFSLKKSTIRKFGRSRVCKECGIDLIDWKRIHKNDPTDADFIFKSLKIELIRHVVWHSEIDQTAIDLAINRGKNKLEHDALKLLKSRIGKKNAWDGRQTPKNGDEIINYAQHATATCCRKCLDIWHNIPEDIEITTAQYVFFTKLIMLFIKDKIPEIFHDKGKN